MGVPSPHLTIRRPHTSHYGTDTVEKKNICQATKKIQLQNTKAEKYILSNTPETSEFTLATANFDKHAGEVDTRVVLFWQWKRVCPWS